ncbi:hypothetical protein ACNJKD_17745 [Edwardsiella tarda]|uniref:hypothetical protein n=1 Tax=Edwardsiella tarda TaxID=636 RepID=UPI00351D13BE
MKSTKILLSITLFFLIGTSFPSIGSTITKPQKACRDLAFNPSSETSMYISAFLARYGDAYRPVTKEDYQKLLFGLCMEEISAAERASSLDKLDLYLFSARGHWIDILGYPVEMAENIARDYYRALHNIQPEKEVLYPKLPANPTNEEKMSALEKYASQKLLRGMPIKDHCEFMAKKMPNNELPADNLKRIAVHVCEGVMTMNFTKGKHGISGKTAMDIVGKEYGKNSNEYRYFEHITNMAFSESK